MRLATTGGRGTFLALVLATAALSLLAPELAAAAPSISVDDVTAAEGTGGDGHAVFRVRLSEATLAPVSVSASTSTGTAGAADFRALAPTPVSFAPGETERLVDVGMVGDSVDEPDEAFNLNLAGASGGATIADNRGVATIADDDAPPSVSVGDVAIDEPDSAYENATFTVSLSAASAKTVTVSLRTADGTASSSDYSPRSDVSLSFAPGTTSKQVNVPVRPGDSTDEYDETFHLDVAGATNATVSDGRGTATITDDDTAPTLSVGDVTIDEPDSAYEQAAFTVSLSARSGRPVTVTLGTADGTADSADYSPRPDVALTIPAGATSRTVNVPVRPGDRSDEYDETFHLDVKSVVNADAADGRGTATITDDDGPPAVSIDDVRLPEPGAAYEQATFTVSLSEKSSKPVSVVVDTLDGSADTADYSPRSNVLVSFPAGTRTRTVNVPVRPGDSLDEDDETFHLDARDPVNAVFGDGRGTATIVDDDASPSLAISDVSISESRAGLDTATFTLSLSARSGRTVTATVRTLPGTAGLGDYETRTGVSVSFPAGATTRTVSVPITADALDEDNETFQLDVTSLVNAQPPAARGTATIVDDDPPPALAVGDVSIDEPDSAYENASFAVSLSAPSGRPVTVSLRTADGSAGSSDYSPRSDVSLTIPAGATTRTVNVPVRPGDTMDEPDETFHLDVVGAATNATVADGRGTATIADDDPEPSVSVGDVTIDEPGSAYENATFTVSLSARSGKPVTVNLQTADGSATNADYSPRTGVVLTIPAGAASRVVNVPVRPGDTLDEIDETFHLDVTSATNATVSDGRGTATITDDDAAPSVSVGDVALDEPGPLGADARFTVTLSAPSAKAVTVDLRTVSGSAGTGDYRPRASVQIGFPAGTTNRTVDVAVLGDSLDEDDETFDLEVASATNAGVADGSGRATIRDDDATPTLSISDTALDEPGTAGANATFTLTLSAPSGRTVSAVVDTADGSATGADYDARSAVAVTLAAGETSRTVDVHVLGDSIDEDDETFHLDVSGPSNVTVADGRGTATIRDDDAAPDVSIGDVSIDEPDGADENATFTVSLSHGSSRTIGLSVSTADGTAGAADYVARSAVPVSFAPGQTSRQVTVAVHTDALDENDETFHLDASAPVNAGTADGRGTATIADDDAPPGLSIGDASIDEPDGADEDATLTVTLSAASGRTVHANLATADGTAGNADYVARSGVGIDFAPGETSKSVKVAVHTDALDEFDETFHLDASGVTGASVTDGRGTTSIADDDSPPSLSVSDVSIDEPDGADEDATFTVSLSAPSGKPVSATAATAVGTAGALDFTARSGVPVAFAAGDTTKPVAVKVRSDALDEFDEDFHLDASGATNASIADARGTATIADDDAEPTVSIADAAATEPSSGSTTASATVSLSAVSGKPVTVRHDTADGLALAGSDYTARSNDTITIPAGSVSAAATVPILSDPWREPSESFTQGISSPVNATIGDGSGSTTIAANCHDREPELFDMALDLGSVSGDIGDEVVKSAPGASICPGDEDWFKVRLREDSAANGDNFLSASIELDVADGTLNGDLDMFVYNSDGTLWDSSEATGTTDEGVYYTIDDSPAIDSDYVYVAIIGYSPTATPSQNDYSLQVVGNQ